MLFSSRWCGLGVAGWERAETDREHAAEAQAAWAVGLHGSSGALLGVGRSRGEGGPPSPGSSSLLENGSLSVLRSPLPSIAVSPFCGHDAHSPSPRDRARRSSAGTSKTSCASAQTLRSPAAFRMGRSVVRLEQLASLVGRGLGGRLGSMFNRVQRDKRRQASSTLSRERGSELSPISRMAEFYCGYPGSKGISGRKVMRAPMAIHLSITCISTSE